MTVTESLPLPPTLISSDPDPCASGAQAGGVSVMVNVAGVEASAPPLAVPPSSRRTTVAVAVPDAPATGLKVSTPVAGLMAGWTANSKGLSVDTEKFRDCVPSSAGPPEIAVAHPATVCAPASDATITFDPAVNEGASLTAATVTASGASTHSPPPSVARTVRVAEPFAFGA